MYGIPESPVTERGARGGAASPGLEAPEITGEMIQAHIDRGRRLRAEAMARGMQVAASALVRGLRRLLVAGRARVADGASIRLSHDLRTPLTTIRASSELLIDNPDMPQEHRRRFLDSIHEEALRLERTVDAITGPAASSSRA